MVNFIYDLPTMRYLDGMELDQEEVSSIISGAREVSIIGFCSETGYNILETGDELIIVHSADIRESGAN